MKKSVVTGATGFVGRHLCALLPAPNVLTRNPERVPSSFSESSCFRWIPDQEPPPAEAFEDCDTVFHLAGESVAEGRWTAAKKARIRDSRVLGTRNLVKALQGLDSRPGALVAASAVGYYGSRGEEALDEESSAATGFLPDVCREWESEARAAEELGIRVVNIRIGMVLGKDGGALAKMLPLFKLGVGGRLGDGQQWMSWIHVGDLARLFVFAGERDDIKGPVNGTAPHPVRNRAFTRSLGNAVRRPAILPAPAAALRFALGGFAEVLLASQIVAPKAALAAGFEFEHSTIESALSEL